MTAEQFGVLIGLTILFTFVFDVVDLQPQIGSFRFLQSLTYWFYLVFRALLGVLAGIATYAVSEDLALPFVALIGVLASVTILQNFTMSIGGNEIAKLSNLVDNYKAKMVAEEAQRRSRLNESHALQQQQELVKVFDKADLTNFLRQMLLQAGWKPEDINSYLTGLEQGAQGNAEYLEAMMAYKIASMNIEHARTLAEQGRRAQAGAKPAA